MISSCKIRGSAIGSEVRLKKGQVLYLQGDPAAATYTVRQGVARTCRYQADGLRQITGFYFPGDSLGLGAFEYTESAEAVTDLTCLRTDRRATPVKNDNSGPNNDEVSLLHSALNGAHNAMALLGRRTAPERVAAFLLSTAERSGNNRTFELAMSRTDIADFLGLTIHTVSRTISQLCSDGLLALDGPQHCRIINPTAMRALAGLES